MREGVTRLGCGAQDLKEGGIVLEPQIRRSSADIDKQIRTELALVSESVRARHALLAHQDAIGLGIFLVSCAAIVVGAILYVKALIPGWLVFVSAALFMSLLHELEHDLIHHLYFQDNPVIYNLMLGTAWLFRPSTISPWVRRSLHLHHHKVSGGESDMEERAITLGEPFGLRRLLMMSDGMLAIFLRLRTFVGIAHAYADSQKPATKRAKQKILWRNRLGYVPFGHVHFALWHSFVALHILQALMWFTGFGQLPSALLAYLSIADTLAVVWLGPNMLRSFCLNFVSSNMHYYGDNEPKNIVQQTQVWTAAWTWPFQLFCFNFGGTHAIHHFVVRDPFYLRQMIAKEAHEVLRKHGVRFNDFGTFKRNNRWHRAATTTGTRSQLAA